LDLQYLRLRWSATLGREVAPCAPLEAGATPARDMAPTGTVGWGTLGIDGWGWPAPGLCIIGHHDCFGFDVGRRHYCTGLFAHGPSDITITVPAGKTRLRGAVGLQRYGGDCGNGAMFRVEQDGAMRWQSGLLRSLTEPEAFDIAIHPGAVRLVVDPQGE